MAAMVPIFVSGMLGGANFHANPFNLVMWMHIAAIYCLVRYDRDRCAPEAPREPSEHSSLVVADGRRAMALSG